MATTRKLLPLLCLTILMVSSLAYADDTDIFGSNIQPNVMLVLDSSGSMSDQILSDPYDSGGTYTGTYTSTVVYKYASNKYTSYATTVSLVNSSTAQTSLNSVGYWSGKISGSTVNLYLGNYLNWTGTSGNTQVQKIVIAQRVLADLVTNTEGVLFGLAVYKNNANNSSTDGAAIMAPMGTAPATIVSLLNTIAPNNYTPLGEALRDIGTYFSGGSVNKVTYNSSGTPTYTKTTFANPIQYQCQPNFVILMTDGLQNGSVDVRTQATLQFTTDHNSTFPGIQNLTVDTIGFALSAADAADGANDILQTAATNGGGTFYSTDGEQKLEAALQDAIRTIVASTFTFATPVIPTNRTLGSTNGYIAAVQSNPSRPFWRGFLKAYTLDSTGNIPVDPNTGFALNAPVWEAGAILANTPAANRTIYTVTSAYSGGTSPPSMQSFATTNTNLTTTLLGVSTSTAVSNAIQFIRGIDVTDENGNGNTTEEREWKLGDIFHSTPVVVAPPSKASSDSTYVAFRVAQASRPTVVIVGANDGMLHAFKETNGAVPAQDGTELWAFIPPDQLPDLNGLLATTGSHLYYQDGSPVAADVKISGAWKTIVVFGERRGGPYYHALDVTDTTAPKYLWSFTDSKISETWSTPVIGKVKVSDGSGGTIDKYVAFFGGGYDTANNNAHGKAVFAVDVATGSILWQYYYSTGATDDRKYMNFSIAADPLSLDLNSDGYVDRLYIGDVGGQLWKFDLSATATLSGGTSGTVTNWTGKRFFAATPSQANPPATGEYYPAQAIYGGANAAYDTSSNLWIYFGTGDRNHPNNSSTNRFYGIKDNTDMTNASYLAESNLTDITTTNATITQGWFIQMATYEKILAAPTIFNSIVYFTSFTYTSTTTCGSGGGAAKMYAVQMATGYAAINWSTGATYTASNSSASNTRSTSIGSGIPSEPVIIITDSGTSISASVIAATTNQQISSNAAPPPNTRKKVLYWKENFQ